MISLAASSSIVLLLFVLVAALFVFELWQIFDYGDCDAINAALKAAGEKQKCTSAAFKFGFGGWLFDLVPGLSEAALFEGLNALFMVVATKVTLWQNWCTEESHDKSFIFQIFAMELVGMFTWYFYLAFVFTPTYPADTFMATCPVYREGNEWLEALDIRCVKEKVGGNSPAL